MEQRINYILKIFLLVIILILILFPFWWMIATSLKSGVELYSDANPLWPERFQLNNYKEILNDTKIIRWIINSFVISFLSSCITLLLSIPAAFAIAKIPSTHSKVFGISAILGYGLPPILIMIPLFTVITRIGFYDNPWVLIVVYPSFLIPFATWLLAGYIKTVPLSVEYAARIDGCSTKGILHHITLPLIKEGILSTFAFCFLLAWGEYIYALSFISSQKFRTLTVGLATLETGDVYAWGKIMAASVIATVPVLLLSALLRKQFVYGLTAGALKK